MATEMVDQAVLSRIKPSKGDPWTENRVTKLVQPQNDRLDDAEWEYEYSATETEVRSRRFPDAETY